MSVKYDVVYYWAQSKWHTADPFVSRSLGGVNGNIDELVTRTERMGYHCIKGLRSIGAPEGPLFVKHAGCQCNYCRDMPVIFSAKKAQL